MERRLNLATLMGLALLLLASTVAAAGVSEEQETVPGAVPGMKFCAGMTKSNGLYDGYIVLSQHVSSYEPQVTSTLIDDSYYEDYSETCFDLWYDESTDVHYSEATDTYTDLYSYLEAAAQEGNVFSIRLDTDIDFGGITTDSTCAATFKPLLLSGLKYFKGEGRTIKNLCYVTDPTNQQDQAGTTQASGIGFFSELSGTRVNNLNFENVYMKASIAESERMYGYIVPTGVVAGRVRTETSIVGVMLKNVKVVSPVAGGVVGHIPESSSSVSISDISGENVEVVMTGDMLPSKISDADCAFYKVYLGGVVGFAEDGFTIANVGIVGLNVRSEAWSVKRENVYDNDNQNCLLGEYLGGLVGFINGMGESTVNMVNNYTVGSVSAPSLCTSDSCKVGFLAGYGSFSSSVGFVIGNNYHYGETDSKAAAAIGVLRVQYQDFEGDSWKNVDLCNGSTDGDCYNYRNIIEGSIESNDAGFDTVAYHWVDATAAYYGGAIPAELMKKDDFAAALTSMAYEYSGSYSPSFWSRKDGVNDGLPVYASATLRPIYRIEFMANSSYYEKASEKDKNLWRNAGAEEDPDGDYVFFLSATTDYTGRLTDTSWQKAATELAEGDYYWTNNGEEGIQMTKSMVFAQPMSLELADKITVNVVYGLLDAEQQETVHIVSFEDAEALGKVFYFMGNPIKSFTSDSVWARVPYIALYDEDSGEYLYYGFRFYKKECRTADEEELCSMIDLDLNGVKLYTQTLYEMSSGDTLYVVYTGEYLTELNVSSQERVKSHGGHLFVSDLHGNGFDASVADVQVQGWHNDEKVLFGEPSGLNVSPDPVDVLSALGNITDVVQPVPYGPYLKVNYPSDFWNRVDDIVGLVVVGNSGSGSSSADLLSRAATMLSDMDMQHPLLADTLSALETPAEIKVVMDSHSGEDLTYTRYVSTDEDGILDLSNLLSVIESERNDAADYPIYVGFLPKTSDLKYHISFDANTVENEIFIATPWIDGIPDSTYSNENKRGMFYEPGDWGLFKANACYAGQWLMSANQLETGISYVEDLQYMVEEMEEVPYTENNDGSRSMTLYAEWESVLDLCMEYETGRVKEDSAGNLVWNNRILEDKSEGGNVFLQQIWQNQGVEDTVRHTSTQLDEVVQGIYIPNVNSSSFTFEVYADGMPGYEMEGDIVFTYEGRNGTVTKVLQEGDSLTITPEMDGMTILAEYGLKSYDLVFDTGDKEGVFYGPNTSTNGTYKLESVEDSIEFPKWVYTANQCVTGWSERPVAEEIYEQEGSDGGTEKPVSEEDYRDRGSRNFNFGVSEQLVLDNGNRMDQYPMYAVWADAETCAKDYGYALVKLTAENGSVEIEESWDAEDGMYYYTHTFTEDNTMLLPGAEESRFMVQAYADDGYRLDSLVMSLEDGSTYVLFDGDYLPEGFRGASFEAFFSEITMDRYDVVFDVGETDVLYGENSGPTATYFLGEDEVSYDLPRWVYTADKCVEGWSIRPISYWEEEIKRSLEECKNAHEDEEICNSIEQDRWWVLNVFDYPLAEELQWNTEEGADKYSLYAVWADAEKCVNEYGYGLVSLESANGTVKLEEVVRDTAGKASIKQVHAFAENGTMLMPENPGDVGFVVRGISDEGYNFDSLVVTLYKGSKDQVQYVYHEGDTLSDKLRSLLYTASFEAYFAKPDTSTIIVPADTVPMEFVKAELRQSGNAVQLWLETNEFSLEDAVLRVVLENDDGENIVDSLLADGISKVPYSVLWEHYPLVAGNYLLTAILSSGEDTVLFEKDFEVKTEVTVVKNGWRMTSLANVVMDSVVWDEDAKFFWWNESKPYGIAWQYQEFLEGDKVDTLTGYWYSSLEGRPLVFDGNVDLPEKPVAWNLDSVYSGWNMVANPYGWYVDLYGENPGEKKSVTERSDVEFYSWNDSLGDYEPVDVIGPYEAVWAKVKGPSQWKLPSKPAFVATVDENGNDSLMNPLKKTVELASGGKGWAIRAVLRDAKGKRDSWNFMGVSESGWASEEPPSGMGDRVNLSIKDGNKSLAKSFKKAAGDSYEWTVSLEASGDRTGYLHFEGVRDLNAAGLKVFVTVDGTTTQMAENDTLKVSIGSMAKTAVVRVAPSTRTVVAQKLNGLRAFQAGNSLQVGFQVSESLAGAKAYVEILNMKGKVLSSVSGTAVSGSNALTLQTPKSGLYMVRVRVGSKQAAGSVAIK